MKKLISLVLAACLLLTLSLSSALATGVDENAGTTVTADGSVISANPTADGSANGTAAAPAGPVTNADGSVSNPDGSLTFPGADSQQAGTAADGAAAVNTGVGITTVTTSNGSDSATVTTDAGTVAAGTTDSGTTATGTTDAGTTAAGTTDAGTTAAGTTAAGTTATGTTTSATTTTGTAATSTGTANSGTAGPIEGAVSGSAAASSGLTHYPASGKTRQKNVIMRKEADSKSKKVVTFSKKGQELTVTGEETVDGVLWYAVTSPKGKEGYVQGIYVSVEESDRINAVRKSGAPKKMEVTIEASCADYQGLGKTWTKQYEVNGVELAEKGGVVEMAEGVEFSYLTCLVNKNANGISKEAYAPTAGDLTTGFTRTQNMIAVSKKGKQIQWSITFTFMPEGTAAAAKAAARAEAAQTGSNGTGTTTVKKATNTSSKKTTKSTRREVVTYQLDAASDKPTQAVAREIDHYEDREMEVTERVQTGTKTYYAYETDEKGKSVMVEKTKPVYTTQTVRKVVSVPVYKDELPPGYTSSSSSSASATAATAATTNTTAGTTATTAGTTTTTTTAGTTAAAVPEADDLEEETVTETVTETVETVPAATTTTTTTETAPAAATQTTETVPAATTTTETVPAATTTAETVPAATTTTETVPTATTTTTAETAPAATATAAAGAVKTKDQLTAEYSLMFFGPVNNDTTGNLRVAQYFAAAAQEQFARDYYYAYFTNDNEIHALISPMTQTTAKISVFGGSKLLVVIYSYVNGEESNAAVLFTGNMVGAYQIDLATGEIVNMTPAG